MFLANLVAAAVASAQSNSADETAARQAITEYVEAWNSGAQAELASRWTADADFVDVTGRAISVHDLLREKAEADIDTVSRPKMTVDVTSVRLVSDGVALADGMVTLSADSKNPASRNHFATVLVRQQGRWLLARVREFAAADKAQPNPLHRLHWLIGEWVGQTDSFTIRSRATWCDNGRDILRNFEAREDGRTVFSGTQLLAWDPREGCITGRIVDSEGIVCDAFWEETDDGWLVRVHGMTPDGDDISATNLYTEISDKGYLLESNGARVGNISSTDLKIRVRRAARED